MKVSTEGGDGEPVHVVIVLSVKETLEIENELQKLAMYRHPKIDELVEKMEKYVTF